TGGSGPANIAAPGQPGFGTLMQNYTESSNVDAVSEITALIVAQRAYEMNSKVITTADQMLQATSQLRS
ncbi:MAG TPA: flagellar basal body rod C-terminal domain-containing protein, partial [Caulobacter sp.]|nr:flagellar basal body rod C-terminal domain-containing protein [Caulobacter sp.]